MPILLVLIYSIGSYWFGGYCWLFYWWLLVVIGCSFVSGY